MLSRLLRRAAVVTAAAAVALVPLALPVAADAAVKRPVDIVRVHFNPAGADRPGGEGREFIELRNTSGRTIDLTGYVIRDSGPQTYRFPRGFRLAAGRTVIVRSGTGRNAGSTLYWGKRSYIWNNTGDVARLYSPRGAQIETCDFTRSIKRLGTTKVC